jgi:DNA-binding transcriptional MerR regulator
LVEQLLGIDPSASGRAVPERRLVVLALMRDFYDGLLLLAFRKQKSYYATSSPLEVKVSALDITEVAQRAGVPASTLRFYEAKGLIVSVGRRGLHRLFASSVLERLALIAMGRAAGFSLDEIARMFTPDGRPRIDRRVLAAKAEELDRTIRKLTKMRDGLRHAAACPAPTHMECPKFRRILRVAVSGAIGRRRKEPLKSP